MLDFDASPSESRPAHLQSCERSGLYFNIEQLNCTI